jgi:hypothetical protein
VCALRAMGACALLVLLPMLCVCMSAGTMCFIGIECVRVCGVWACVGQRHTKSPYHCSLEPALVADEQWGQQFTIHQPASRPCGPAAWRTQHHDTRQRACSPPTSKAQPRPLRDVHQLCSAGVTYQGKITSKREN